jgi:hypothetical protein
MEFGTKTYVSGTHSLNRMAIYYYKEYYKESMKLTPLQSQIKEEIQIKRIATKKECSRLKKSATS